MSATTTTRPLHDPGVAAGPAGGGDLGSLWHACAAASSMFERQAVVPAPQLREHLDDTTVVDLLRRALDDPAARRMLKVTVDGTQSTATTERVVGAPPREGETTREWTRRLFGTARVGVGLNGVQRWSEQLTRVFAEVMAPVWDHCEHGWVDLRLTLFLGNYGFTDGGAHRDVGHPERVIHLNLGPAPKVFHTWTPDEFAAATGGLGAVRVPPFPLGSARSASFGPHELFVLNVSDFHVADNDEHSVSVAVEMIRRTPAEVLAEVAGRLAPVSQRSAAAAFLSAGGEADDVRRLLAGADLGARFAEAVDDLAARSRSNAGFRGSPRPRTDQAPPGPVRRRPTYPLERGSGGVLHARGSALRLPGQERELAAVAGVLDSGLAHTRADVVAATGIAAELVDGVVDALWRTGALEPVAGDTDDAGGVAR
ncbi:hypothetical protein [Nocardioides dongxiaopingii]|uniref:hypothetical protein n=1 Tax=Nocardioides dongxiaopingii TaxID=2576036 RepID=UPI0010C762FD|nr:hypothetical protein [Nocardioides dongxiaopingii]